MLDFSRLPFPAAKMTAVKERGVCFSANPCAFGQGLTWLYIEPRGDETFVRRLARSHVRIRSPLGAIEGRGRSEIRQSARIVEMRKTQYFTASSIDGFIADADNSLGWLSEAHTADREEGRWHAFFDEVGAMAMGATTYRWVLDEERLLERPEKWHEFYADVPCWVFTHQELPPIPDADLTFVQGDVATVHAAMTAAAGDKNIWLVGGGDLVGQFADEGLVDELLIHIAPVMLGAGAPLLPRRMTSSSLTLLNVEEEGGFAYLSYRVSPPTP